MQTHRAASAAKRDISKLLHALRHICADFSRLSNDRTAIIAFVNLLHVQKYDRGFVPGTAVTAAVITRPVSRDNLLSRLGLYYATRTTRVAHALEHKMSRGASGHCQGLFATGRLGAGKHGECTVLLIKHLITV